MSSRRRARLDRARRLARARRPADPAEIRWMAIWKELPPHVSANIAAIIAMRNQADPGGEPVGIDFTPEDPLDDKIADIAKSLWVTVDDLTRKRRWSFDGGIVREADADG